LALLAVVFLRELAACVPKTLTMGPDTAILTVLTLIDLTHAANLLVIKMFSGYETFVSKFDLDDHSDRPGWMGRVDFSGLKI